MMRLRCAETFVAALIVLAGFVSLSGCASLSYRDDERPLYTGADVDITVDESHTVRRTRRLASELEASVRPLPNRTFLGVFRPGLWVYSATGAPDPPGIGAWIFQRYGEFPVYFEQVSPEAGARTIRTVLKNRGFFDSEVAFAVEERRSGTGVRYLVLVREPYIIASIRQPDGDNPLSAAIRATADETLLSPGNRYDLRDLIAERQRIDRALKEQGYYGFNPGYIIFEATRDHDARTVDLQLTLHPDTPPVAGRQHPIRTITVYADYDPAIGDTERDESVIEVAPAFYYVPGSRRLRPDPVYEAILLRPGQLYRRSDHLRSIDRLSSLDLFRFVTIRYVYDEDGESLHARIYLSPLSERAIEGEIQVVTRSNNLAGPNLRVGYRDRNLLAGAERFSLDVNAGVDTQLGIGGFSVDQWEIGVASSIAAPRIIAPFVSRLEHRGPRMPRTTLSAGVRSLTRFNAYRLDEISTTLGYSWTPSENVRYEVRPIALAFVRPGAFTSPFEELLEANPAMKAGFTEQLIIGSQYTVVYDNTASTERRIGTSVSGSLEVAGIGLSAANRIITGEPVSSDSPATVLGVPYSQFVRVDTDVRNRIALTERSVLASRMLAGTGYAFGNSSVLPLTRQFSVGGPNSIRAIPARSIGPGTLAPKWAGGPPFDRSADIRLEGNLEYRFPLLGFLGGALFFDAGNTWTLAGDTMFEDTTVPTRFAPETFLGELAVGSGIGLRADFSAVVLRLDVATLLRKPWLPPEERWVVDQISFGDRDWRRENLVWSLAIGYPF